MRHPAAPTDRLVRVSTAGVWGLGTALLVGGAAVGVAGEPATGVLLAAGGAGVVVLCAVHRRLQPVGNGLEIERRGRVPRRYAGFVAWLPDARLGLRIAGSGGLYGYLGRFRLVGGGRVDAFVTSRAATLIVGVGDAAVAVSPADRDLFLGDVEGRRA